MSVKNMTVSLCELQKQFQAYILQAKDNNILKTISTEQADAKQRIDIYRNGYSLRLLEILEKDFPNFRKYIDDELFETIGRGYINSYPSDNFSICVFSRHFNQYLIDANYEQHWPELAQFEWALSCVLDAPDAPHITMTDLGSVAGDEWPYIQFSLHPSFQIHEFHYNAPQILHALMEQREQIPEVKQNESPLNWIVWRFEMNSYFESITPEQLWMIEALQTQSTFAQICEGLCQWIDEEQVAQYAAGSLRNWIEKGIFSAYSISSELTN